MGSDEITPNGMKIPEFSGRACPSLTATRQCNTVACPTHEPTTAPTTTPTPDPTHYPTSEPTAHHCEDGSHYCWRDGSSDAKAACVKLSGDTYECQCHTGFATLQQHVSHDSELKHKCEKTPAPTAYPTAVPTTFPTSQPTVYPALAPTPTPTAIPTNTPTHVPTLAPTKVPTQHPTAHPSSTPTAHPTHMPSKYPTSAPTAHHCDGDTHYCW